MAKFRFQDLKIWRLAIEIASGLFDVADELEKRKLYRFADRLRGAGMSMSNNIVLCVQRFFTFGWHVMPHLMRHPGSVFLDSCLRRNDNHSKGIYGAVQ